MPAVTDSAPRVPRDLDLAGRFTDLRLARSGAQFSVYEAREVATGRILAIKVADDARPGWVHDMLRSQAELLARIGKHPHIVTLHDSVRLADRRPALVLDRGVATLAERPGDPLSLQYTLSLGIKLAGALETVHDAGALHCDVRPRSILVDRDDEPLLAAFDEVVRTTPGAARFPHHAVSAHTAPELLEGGDPVPASDVYGLASTLYELVAGHAAFRRYAGESAATVIVRVLSGQASPVVAPDVPREISDLLTWAMSSEPAKRPPSAAWFAEELGRVEAQLGFARTRMIVGA